MEVGKDDKNGKGDEVAIATHSVKANGTLTARPACRDPEI